MDYSDEWLPLFEEDLSLDFRVHPISYMRHMVFERNESWDAGIYGWRGDGKSTIGLSMITMMNPKLLDMSPRKALRRSWAFTTEDRNEKKQKLRRGDVLGMDEQGTKHSGSSYKWASEENQQLADAKQVDRVDGVWEVGISLDPMRVAKRVRNLARVIIIPDEKLSNAQNRDMGLGNDCVIRQITENIFATSESDRHKAKYFKYTTSGRIARVVLPHPPPELWNEYMLLRKEFKESIDNEEVPNAMKSKNVEEEELDDVISMYQQRERLNYKIDKLGK